MQTQENYKDFMLDTIPYKFTDNQKTLTQEKYQQEQNVGSMNQSKQSNFKPQTKNLENSFNAVMGNMNCSIQLEYQKAVQHPSIYSKNYQNLMEKSQATKNLINSAKQLAKSFGSMSIQDEGNPANLMNGSYNGLDQNEGNFSDFKFNNPLLIHQQLSFDLKQSISRSKQMQQSYLQNSIENQLFDSLSQSYRPSGSQKKINFDHKSPRFPMYKSQQQYLQKQQFQEKQKQKQQASWILDDIPLVEEDDQGIRKKIQNDLSNDTLINIKNNEKQQKQKALQMRQQSFESEDSGNIQFTQFPNFQLQNKNNLANSFMNSGQMDYSQSQDRILEYSQNHNNDTLARNNFQPNVKNIDKYKNSMGLQQVTESKSQNEDAQNDIFSSYNNSFQVNSENQQDCVLEQQQQQSPYQMQYMDMSKEKQTNSQTQGFQSFTPSNDKQNEQIQQFQQQKDMYQQVYQDLNGSQNSPHFKEYQQQGNYLQKSQSNLQQQQQYYQNQLYYPNQQLQQQQGCLQFLNNSPSLSQSKYIPYDGNYQDYRYIQNKISMNNSIQQGSFNQFMEEQNQFYNQYKKQDFSNNNLLGNHFNIDQQNNYPQNQINYQQSLYQKQKQQDIQKYDPITQQYQNNIKLESNQNQIFVNEQQQQQLQYNFNNNYDFQTQNMFSSPKQSNIICQNKNEQSPQNVSFPQKFNTSYNQNNVSAEKKNIARSNSGNSDYYQSMDLIIQQISQDNGNQTCNINDDIKLQLTPNQIYESEADYSNCNQISNNSSALQQHQNTQIHQINVKNEEKTSLDSQFSSNFDQEALSNEKQKLKSGRGKGRKNKNQSKINTAHVPTNLMNSMLPFLIAQFGKMQCRNNLGAQVCETVKLECDCKLCRECREMQKIKSSCKNKSIATFRQLWQNSKLVRFLTEEYFLYYSPHDILQKKTYRNHNPEHKLSTFKCLPKFLEGVRNYNEFHSIL